MATTGPARLIVPGAISENHVLAAAFIAFPVIAAIDLEFNPTVPLNLFYVFPLAFVALHAKTSPIVYVAAAFSFLLQFYVLYSYELNPWALLADTFMIACACGMTALAVRAMRRGHFRAEALASNTKLAAALESMTDAVFITDTRGNIIDFNQAFVSYHRFGSRQECAESLSGYPALLEFMTSGGEPVAPEQWAVPRALRGESATNADYRLRLKSTGEAWIGSYSFAPVRDDNGVIIGSVVTSRDVTSQRMAEQHLAEAYDLLSMAEESAAAGSWTWDLVTNTMNWSPRLYRLFGLHAGSDEASIQTWRKACHPDDVAGVERSVSDAIKQHSPLILTYRTSCRDCETKWIDVLGSTACNERGEPVRMSGICIDVTRRKVAEERLKETESDFRAFFDNVSIGATRIDSSGRFLDVNARLCDLAGYSHHDLVGSMSPLDLTHPDERQEIKASISRVFAGNDKFYHGVNRLVRRDGSTRWVEITATPIRDQSGHIQRVAALIADITQRREAEIHLQESEASLRTFFDSAAVGAVQLDEKGRFIRVNPAYCAIVGYTSDELLGRMTPFDIDAPEFRTADRSGLDRLFDGLDEQYVVEKQIVRKDGTCRWVRVAASVVERHGKDILRTAALVTDITSRKEAEARLLESRDQLQRLNLSLEAEVQSRTASLVELNHQLERLARMDALTEIPNRLAANERLRQEFIFMKRMTQPYSVLMIDIDHFKAVNDAYGHEVGDRVLREVAQQLRKELRESDFIARFGGEEFLAVLPATAMAGGLVVAGKLRRAIEELKIEGVVHVTISIGVSVALPENESQDEAVNKADDRLYEAKAAGRNRVVGSSGSQSQAVAEVPA